MKGRQRLWLTLSIFAVIALMVSGCSGADDLSTLTPKGTAAEISFDLTMLSVYIMLGVMTIVVVIYVYVLIRFRKKKNDTSIPKQVEGSTVLEIIWTTIPIILLIILAIPTVIYTFALAEDYSEDPDAIQVKVTAHQYWWEFEYPELGIKTAQDLYIPVGKKINVTLTSADVIHSFWVPALAGKIDTNPGFMSNDGKQNENHMWFDAKEPGVYKGKCAELCGPSHALMDFKVIAVTENEFAAWVDNMKAPNEVTSDLAKQGEEVFNQSCVACHAVDSTDPSNRQGPNLDGFGDRQKIAGVLDVATSEEFKANLKRWIENPDDIKPQIADSNTVKMPAFKDKLSEAQINALVEYLSGLKLNK